jgi:hypothetical protein
VGIVDADQLDLPAIDFELAASVAEIEPARLGH